MELLDTQLRPSGPQLGAPAEPNLCACSSQTVATTYQSPVSILETSWSPAPNGDTPCGAVTPAPLDIPTLACSPAVEHTTDSGWSSKSSSLRSGSTGRARLRPPSHPNRCPSPSRVRSRCRTRGAAVSRSSSLNDEKARAPRPSVRACWQLPEAWAASPVSCRLAKLVSGTAALTTLLFGSSACQTSYCCQNLSPLR